MLFGYGGEDKNEFDLISTTEKSKEVLKILYEEMKKGNVAISNLCDFISGREGLSFLLIDRLTEEDFEKKRRINDRIKQNIKRIRQESQNEER